MNFIQIFETTKSARNHGLVGNHDAQVTGIVQQFDSGSSEIINLQFLWRFNKRNFFV